MYVSLRRIGRTAAIAAGTLLVTFLITTDGIMADTLKTNRLIDENSPYLLSHAHNPVDWYPWGEEALTRARLEDKPIFLSIGYAACHWCHVMERESFEDDSIAELMNRHFINIKVDREQRPDLDHIYMSFTTAMTGQGGWPMSVFLTPELKPFFAGTYFPPTDRYGRPGFTKILTTLGEAYRDQKDQLLSSSREIFDKVTEAFEASAAPSLLTGQLITTAADQLLRSTDPVHGGIGTAPKFPHPIELQFFFRQYRATGDLRFKEAAEKALLGMARGGIYDHLGGGFARYSVDAQWLVPHFEKMLYDNALLAESYAAAWQVTGDERYRTVVCETLDWLLREMRDSTGGFYSAIDADSEGEEGKFYVWSLEEVETVLGDDAEAFVRYYNVSASGNWEGHNILHLTDGSDRFLADHSDISGRLPELRERLRLHRESRVRPLTDDKILTSWNGLAISGLCAGYQVTGERRYLDAAVDAATFIETTLIRNGSLTHSFRLGRHSEGEFLEDYAYLLRGLLALYQADIDADNHRWLRLAQRLASRGVELFMGENGDLFLREDSLPDLIVRPRDETDSAVPAPGSLFLDALMRLGRLTGEDSFAAAAERGLRAISGKLSRYPASMTSALLALDYWLNDKIEIVVVGRGDDRDQMLTEIRSRYLPTAILAVHPTGATPLPIFTGREQTNGVRVYVCRNSTCRLPASTVEELVEQLQSL